MHPYYNKLQVIVSGIESHVCVQQSVLDLVEHGFEVHLVADALSSQRYAIAYKTYLLLFCARVCLIPSRLCEL